jgi:hypothetical protein
MHTPLVGLALPMLGCYRSNSRLTFRRLGRLNSGDECRDMRESWATGPVWLVLYINTVVLQESMDRLGP